MDRAIEGGPGLRWSLMGTFLTFHLAGGKQGMRHSVKAIWTCFQIAMDKIKSTYTYKTDYQQEVIEGTKQRAKKVKNRSKKISNIRDEYLVKLLETKKKIRE